MAENDIRSSLTEEERRRLERIDRIDANKKNKKIIMFVVTAVLILFFVAGTIFGAIHILGFEGTQALPEDISYPAVPEGEENILASLDVLSEELMSINSVKLDISYGVNIVDGKLDISGENAQGAAVYSDYIKSAAVSLISKNFEEKKGEYGEDFSSLLFDRGFSIEDADITASVNEENENDLKYIFDFVISDEKDIKDSIVYKVFSMEDTDNITDNISLEFKDAADIGDITVTYKSFDMTVGIDRLKQRINNVTQKHVCDITVPLTFKGEWAEFGSITLSFSLEVTKSFTFTRIEFFFTQDVFFVEKGANDEIKAKLTGLSSLQGAEIVFTSSDPDILSIDGKFYKANNVSDKPVTVTGTATYNGEKYTAECIFYVRVPVEGVKVSEKEIKMNIGEKRSLDITVSPDDATLKNVYWFSADESIVKIDENGEITAVGAGSTDVYCITLDGNYKSSCTVEVS